MELTINGEQKVISKAGLSITELLSAENVKSPDMVSVQLNGEFVERSLFADTKVKNGDELDFLYFMGGGQKL
ncbi:MAG: sulfur carrier protein ThiS [Spirochaetales bacterium]|nr:sulfur carrier protein ThiS [Spirochaetales bacterium]